MVIKIDIVRGLGEHLGGVWWRDQTNSPFCQQCFGLRRLASLYTQIEVEDESATQKDISKKIEIKM